MNRRTSYPKEVLKTWGGIQVPVEESAAAAARRVRVVPNLAAAIRGHAAKQRSGRRRVTFGAPAAAAALLGVFVGARAWTATGHSAAVAQTFVVPPVLPAAPRVWVSSGALLLQRASTARLALDDVALESDDDAGDVATTSDGYAHIEIPGGIHVRLRPSTTVRINPRSPPSNTWEIVELRGGQVDVDVAKLGPGGAFMIRAPGADVIVRGTSFTVAAQKVGAGDKTATYVAVSEGTVLVRHTSDSLLVHAGEHWSSARSAPSAAYGARIPPLPGAGAQRPPEATPERTEPTEPSSSLSDQNGLFRAAREARRRGDDRAAVRILDAFLSRYASSPLAQEARVERFRALRKLGDHTAAAQEARRYLAEHKNGVARDEAWDVALGATPVPAPARP